MKITNGAKFLISKSGKSLSYLVDKGFIEYNPNSDRYRLTSKGNKLRQKIAEGKTDKLFPFWKELQRRKIRLRG